MKRKTHKIVLSLGTSSNTTREFSPVWILYNGFWNPDRVWTPDGLWIP